MNEALQALSNLLSQVILPNLKSVQVSQAEQIAANDRLEASIEELRLHLNEQYTQLSAQLTACRAELAMTQAALQAAQQSSACKTGKNAVLVH